MCPGSLLPLRNCRIVQLTSYHLDSAPATYSRLFAGPVKCNTCLVVNVLAAFQSSSRKCRSPLPMKQDRLAVDQHRVHADGQIAARAIRRAIGDGGRIEDDDVGGHPFAD